VKVAMEELELASIPNLNSVEKSKINPNINNLTAASISALIEKLVFEYFPNKVNKRKPTEEIN
jgi:hypothetical protein